MVVLLSETEKAILKTVVYYDCLDYPLSLEELEKFLFYGRESKDDFDDSLKKLNSGHLIDESGTFYFLKDRNDLIETRTIRNRIAKEKWRKTLKAVRWLGMVPYVRMVFASGSLALNNTDKDSDLDVLIVTKFGRIWLARFLVAAMTSLLGMRRTRYEKIASDKICLNHFITEKSLRIPRKSIYTAQLYARLVPILADDEELVDEFYRANSWVGEYIPKFSIFNFQFSNKSQILNPKFLNFIKKTAEGTLNTKLGDWLERILRKYQLRRIKNYHLTYKPGGRVKADDKSLEFHPDSPELRIIEKYNKTMKKIGFPELGEEQDSGFLHTELTEA